MTASTDILVLEKDLNSHGGVFCPSPLANMPIWNHHPKVFLDVLTTGQAQCAYCGTRYVLSSDAHPPHATSNAKG
jgi:uncharacterized Zn-finger protein